MRRNAPLAEKEYVTASDMADEPLIVSRSSPEPDSLFGQVISKTAAGSYSTEH